jgi:hypothetical protein
MVMMQTCNSLVRTRKELTIDFLGPRSAQFAVNANSWFAKERVGCRFGGLPGGNGAAAAGDFVFKRRNSRNQFVLGHRGQIFAQRQFIKFLLSRQQLVGIDRHRFASSVQADSFG